jgi:hypothetical protein
MDQPQTTLDAALAAVGSKVTYAGSGGSVLAWLASSEAGVVFGLFMGLAGLIVNFVFKLREDRRQQEEHEQRMQALRHE